MPTVEVELVRIFVSRRCSFKLQNALGQSFGGYFAVLFFDFDSDGGDSELLTG